MKFIQILIFTFFFISCSKDTISSNSQANQAKIIRPFVGDFYNEGVIVEVKKLSQADAFYSNDTSKPNFLVVKIGLEDIQDTIKNILKILYNKKIKICGELNSNDYLWVAVSDSIIKHGGKALQKNFSYSVALSFNDGSSKATPVYVTKYTFGSGPSYGIFQGLDAVITFRPSTYEYILNNKNYSTPKIGEIYGGRGGLTVSGQLGGPLIYDVDQINRKIKVVMASSMFSYVSYNLLNSYNNENPQYNIVNGFTIPTKEQLLLINQNLFQKALFRFGNNITFSTEVNGNNNSSYNFSTQAFENYTISSTYLIASPLLVSEVSF